MLRDRAALGVVVAPFVGISTGVLAEWVDLNPALLLTIAVPALIISTFAASLPDARPQRTAVGGVALGLATFSLSAGVYLAIHYARGGSTESPGVFFAVHVGVGAIVGLAVGGAVALAIALSRSLRQRRLATQP
jgi:hypothetical protein